MAYSAASSMERIADVAIFEELGLAILHFRYYKLVYTDAAGKSSARKVKPYSLVFRGRGFYLLAYCMIRNDYRLFHVERIKNYEVSEENSGRVKILVSINIFVIVGMLGEVDYKIS